MNSYIGTECKTCYGTVRYKMSNKCVTCARKTSRERNTVYRAKMKQKHKAVWQMATMPRVKGLAEFLREIRDSRIAARLA